MSAEVFFDTNVLVYSLEPFTARSLIADAAIALGGTISVQVLNECASVLRRKKWGWDDIKAALDNLRATCAGPHPLTAAIHEAALKIAARDGLNIYHANVVASALDAGCSTLLSEDMQDGRVFGGRLTIRNPFAAA